MRTVILFVSAILVSFWIGWKSKESMEPTTSHVHGIGGVFFKAKDPVTLKKWYEEKLGFKTDEYGVMFETRHKVNDTKQYLQWSIFNEKTKYFLPSEKQFMINYRVSDLEGLVVQLKKNNVTVLDTIAKYDYGNFVHILDPEMNKIELWEPVDSEFTRQYKGATMY